MWTPANPLPVGPRSQALLAALAADIASGRLRPGERLPPQRELAFRLGIGLGAVTRAYAEAEQRGLIVAHVGRGSFVAESSKPEDEGTRVDLARNLIPLAPARARLGAALEQMRRRPDLMDQLGYAPAAGFERDRRSGAGWIARLTGWTDLDWRRTICCAGAQQAMHLALATASPPGTAVLVEEATFWGLRSLAAHTDRPLVPVAMDDEGLRPDALQQAAAETGATVAYVLPFQNPTARVMGAQRRRAIVDVARRCGLSLIEDDLYAAFAPRGLPPLAALAPDRVFYIQGLSKHLAPGLRAGYLIPPAAAMERVLGAAQALTYAPPGFGFAIAGQWIADGSAEEILTEVKAEVRARTALAAQVLGPLMEPPASGESLHIWLPMTELEAERVGAAALRRGADPTPPAAPVVPGGQTTGLRLCLGPPTNQAQLRRGLEAVRDSVTEAASGTYARAIV